VGTKEGGAESKIGFKRRLTHVPQPGNKKSTVASSVGEVKEGGAAGKKEEDLEMEMEVEEEEEEFFSELHSPQVGKLSHFSVLELLKSPHIVGLFCPYSRSLLTLNWSR
jgi:hypothetical protein